MFNFFFSPWIGDDWKRQTDSSDIWIDTREIHLNDWIPDDVPRHLRVWQQTQGIGHVCEISLKFKEKN